MSDETVLVTGGCGFVGYHVIRTIKEQQREWSVHGMSRRPDRNRVDNVQYHAGDVSSHKEVQEIFRRVSPTIIVHTASPPMVGDQADERSCMKTNVDGTRCLLDCALAMRSVKAFVYTSSALVVEGTTQHMASENAPLRKQTSKCDSYSKSKALAETMVLEANGIGNMLTTCIRLPSTYGERDEQNIGEGIKGLRRGEHRLQIGDNINMCDWLSADNAAQAHILAIKALLSERVRPKELDERVAGESFFVTDGNPLPFWDHFRLIWGAAGDRTPQTGVTRIPPWMIISLAAVIETVYWMFTLGTRKPKALRRDLLALTFVERTFSIEKARRRLAYVPRGNRDVQIQEGVSWYLSQYPAKLGE